MKRGDHLLNAQPELDRQHSLSDEVSPVRGYYMGPHSRRPPRV
jgi:hypothetical protein